MDETTGAITASEFTSQNAPHVDIANDGTVTFESDDASLGPASGSGNVFVWTAEPRRAQPGFIISNIEQYFVPPDVINGEPPPQALAAPVISDDGLALVYYNATTGKVLFHLRSGVADEVPLGGSTVGVERHLDLRVIDTGTGTDYLLLVHTNQAENLGNEVFRYQNGSGDIVAPESLPFTQSGPGSLMVETSTVFGYGAAQEPMGRGYVSEGTNRTLMDCELPRDSMVRLTSNNPGNPFAARCGNKLRALGNENRCHFRYGRMEAYRRQR